MGRARVSVILCLVVAIIYNLPRFFERTTNLVGTGQHVLLYVDNVTTAAARGGGGDVDDDLIPCDALPEVTPSCRAKVIKTALHENPYYIVFYRTGLFIVARCVNIALTPRCCDAKMRMQQVSVIRTALHFNVIAHIAWAHQLQSFTDCMWTKLFVSSNRHGNYVGLGLKQCRDDDALTLFCSDTRLCILQNCN